MNDLVRPALYDAYHHFAAVVPGGAYGATMASTYNCHTRVPEVLVDGDRFAIVPDRVLPEAMLATQHIPFWMRPTEEPARVAA